MCKHKNKQSNKKEQQQQRERGVIYVEQALLPTTVVNEH